MIIWWCLRIAMAPVVESLLLLDRAVYLEERGMSAMIFPAFDPSISPRNFVLAASRHSAAMQALEELLLHD